MRRRAFAALVRAAAISFITWTAWACSGADPDPSRTEDSPDAAGVRLSGFQVTTFKSGRRSSEIVAAQAALMENPGKFSLSDVSILELENDAPTGKIVADRGVFYMDAAPAERMGQRDIRLAGNVIIERGKDFRLRTNNATYRSNSGSLVSQTGAVMEARLGDDRWIEAVGPRFRMESAEENEQFILESGESGRAAVHIRRAGAVTAQAAGLPSTNGM